MKKHQIPVLPDNYLDRDRLCVRLAEAVDVIFLTGREGCGKTSLLTQYCRDKESAVFWYSFEKEDNEEGYFAVHFPYGEKISSCESGICEKGAADGSCEKEAAFYGIKGSGFIGGEGYGVLLELLDDGKVSCIVLDQVHQITNNRLLYVVRRLLESNTGRQKIILSSSELPAPCLVKYFAAGRYRIITDQELCFTDEELLQLTRIYFPSIYFADAAAYALRMQQLTGGWPVAAAYLLRYLLNSGGVPADVMALREQDVLMDTMLYDYIDYEIYRHFSAKEKLFLMRAAVFDRLDTELLRSCLGQSADDRILRRLRGKNLIRKAKGRDGVWAGEQYQPLLRLFLRAQISQEQKEKLLRQAGSYYLQKREFEEAFDYMKQDADGVREMLLQSGREMMRNSFLELTGRCIALLKAARQEWTEWACQELEIAAEYYYRLDDREQMEACLNAADSMFGKENPYGTYRSLYRGLFHYREDRGKYEKQVHSAIFFLRENGLKLPFLLDREQKLLDEIQSIKKDSSYTAAGKKIRVSAFGTFRAVILADGKELSWRTRKGCELFAYLLDLNGEAVERKTLLTELWQDEMPNNAVAMLHNMFYNIRKELSCYSLESLIQYKNRKYVMDTDMIQSDLEQIRMAAEYVEKKDTAMLMRHRELFDSRWGMYLEDMDNVWIRDRQEYYEKIFEKGCILLGTECMEQGDYEAAAGYLKNALSVSCYSEKTMGMLLKCYRKAGELACAKKQYEDFCSLLKRELGIEPGEELQAGYQACIGKGGSVPAHGQLR